MSKTRWPKLLKLRERWRHAFALESPYGPLTEEDLALLDRLAEKVVARRMAMPAILFLQSMRPLSGIGSQAMVFLAPFLTPLLNTETYNRIAEIMDRREGIMAMVGAIEAAEARRTMPEEGTTS